MGLIATSQEASSQVKEFERALVYSESQPVIVRMFTLGLG